MDLLLDDMDKLQECLLGKTSWFGHPRTNLFLYVVSKKKRHGYCHAMVKQILHVFQLIRNKVLKAVFRLFTIPLAFKFTGT